ncbi:MAG: phage replisome organizer N-terminal domain-containing protein, partial [bacterium]
MSNDVKWIKITTNMFDDEKIKLIESMPDADSILVIWIKLLVQAGKTNAKGYIFLNENIPYTDEMLATVFNRPLNTVRLALKTFEDFGMIEMNENGIYIENWSKHQNIEGLEKLKKKQEQNRLRQEKYRKKQQLIEEGKTGNVTVTLSNGSRTRLELDKEIDKELDKDNNIYTQAIEKIYNCWIDLLSDINNARLTQNTKQKIISKLKRWNEEEIISAIKNYNEIYRSDYYYSHSFTLYKFIE